MTLHGTGSIRAEVQTLAEQTFLFLDCQTTSTSPAYGQVIELGWCFASSEDFSRSSHRIESRLIALAPDETIPATVKNMTGLDDRDLCEARSDTEVWRELLAQLRSCERPSVCALAHYAQFERGFLTKLHLATSGEESLPFDLRCTYRITKKLMPELPSATLNAVWGWLKGTGPIELKRASANIEATLTIWSELVRRLDEVGVHSDSELEVWMAHAKTQRTAPGARAFRVEKNRRLEIPAQPGLYRFYSANRTLLYIGKATNLRDRVNSYFRQRKWDRTRLGELMAQVGHFEFMVTGSPLEAALRENDEIKNQKPPYNTALKDTHTPLAYFSTDYETGSERPTLAYSRGPFRSELFREHLDALRVALQGGEIDPVLFPCVENEEITRAGIQLFRNANPDLFSQPVVLERLIRFGDTRTYYEAQEDEQWSLERVVHSIENKLVRAAAAARQSRWLLRLCECTLAWRAAADDWHVAYVDAGQIHFAQEKDLDAVAAPAGYRRTRIQRQSVFDLATYDRMMILQSEIKRLLGGGVPIRLWLSPRCRLGENELGELLLPARLSCAEPGTEINA